MMRVNFDKAEAQRFLEAIRTNAPLAPDGPWGWSVDDMVRLAGVLLYAIAAHTPQILEEAQKMPPEFRDDPRGEHLQRDITAAVEFNAYLSGLVANDEFDALHESPFIAGIKDRADGRKIYPLRGV
jgi:hypothetical protein